MVLQAARLWFHFTTYSRKNKYKNRHTIKKKSSRHEEKQQRHQDAQGQAMNKESKYRNRYSNAQRKPYY